MMRVSVKAEAPEAGKCTHCTYYSRLQYENGHQVAQCRGFNDRGNDGAMRLTGLVSECSRFSDKRQMDMYDMKQIATIIEVEHGRFIGFVRPGEKRHNELLKELLDD